MALNKEQKIEIVEILKGKFQEYNNFYLTDTESLSVEQVNTLRGACFSKNVEMKVAKNTLIKRALESLNSDLYSPILTNLKGVTAIMFSESPKNPAVIISSFRDKNPGDRPILKAAILGDEIYEGDNQLSTLKNIKTRDELIGDIIGLLQSPIQRVIGALENKESASDASKVEEAPAEVVETPAAEATETPADEAPAAE